MCDIGNIEVTKRAVTVAAVGGFSICFKGQDPVLMQYEQFATAHGVRIAPEDADITVLTGEPIESPVKPLEIPKVYKWPSTELDEKCKYILFKAFEEGADPEKLLGIARTIADMDRSVNILSHHMLEAVNYQL